jgi:hypothetical protein
MNKLKTLSSLLLTTEEMLDKYQVLHREKYKYPYFYKIKNEKQVLNFVGPHHTFDPANPQIKRIEKYWSSFLKETEKKGCIVLIEGGGSPVEKTKNEAILKYGEVGLLAFLSAKEKIEYKSPEPDWISEVRRLQTIFTKDEIMYFDFARTVAQWNRLKRKPDFDKYVQRYMKRNKEQLKWDNFDFSTKHFIDIHDRMYDHKFDKNDYECFHQYSSPYYNPIAKSSNVTRDTFILKSIIKLWEGGNNIFIVYGSGHAIVLEPALKKLLK